MERTSDDTDRISLPAWARRYPERSADVDPSRPWLKGHIEIRDTGVSVLDRSAAVLEAVERGASSLRQLVEATGLSQTTAHRLAASLHQHGLLARDHNGRWRLGPRLFALATAARRDLPLRDLARPALARLSEVTGESAQLYLRDGDRRLCVEVVESEQELRTIVPVGSELPLGAGSAGHVFLAHSPPRDAELLLRGTEPPPWKPAGALPWAERMRGRLQTIRRRGWAESVEERERGVASVSAPVLDATGHPAAVVSISGPIGRLGRTPGKHYANAVVTAAREVGAAIGIGPG
jgi:DNA-binding IclR family transcriptional regulator